MKPRVVLIGVLLIVAGHAIGQEIRTLVLKSPNEIRRDMGSDNRAERLAALDALSKKPELASDLASELVRFVESGDDATLLLAARCLATIGEKGTPAVSALIQRMDSNDYIVREELGRTLVAIGATSVEPLTLALSATSPRIRVASLSALDKLTIVSVELLEKLQTDSDVGIRSEVAHAWKKHGKRGVAALVALLDDKEPIVAISAAHALAFHYEDTAAAVPALCECLKRKEVAWIAAIVLGSYGVDARAAIPALVRAGFGTDEPWAISVVNHAEDAVSHIGPPSIEDLDELKLLLRDPSPQVRLLAAKSIGYLEADAANALPNLQRMFAESLGLEKGFRKELALIKTDQEKFEFLGKNPSHSEALDAACLATWQISKDALKWLEMVQQLVLHLEDSLYFGGRFSSIEFGQQDILRLIDLLESDESIAESTRHTIICRIPAELLSAESYERIRKLADKQTLSYITYRLDSKKIPNLANLLLEDCQKKRIELGDLVEIIGTHKLKDDNLEKILARARVSRDFWVESKALFALASISDSPTDATKLLIEGVRENKHLADTAIENLPDPPHPFELSVPFVIDCLDSQQLQQQALCILSKIGPDAKAALPALREIWNKNKLDKLADNDIFRLATIALAESSISGDREKLNWLFNQVIENRSDDQWRYQCQFADSIGRLGTRGSDYLDLLERLAACAENSRTINREWLDSILVNVASCRSPNAVELLRRYSNHRDWQIRTLVDQLLNVIKKDDLSDYADLSSKLRSKWRDFPPRLNTQRFQASKSKAPIEIIKLIDSCSDWPDQDSSAVNIIRATNKLIQLDHKTAIDILAEYLDKTSTRHGIMEGYQVYALIQCAFEPAQHGDVLPPPRYLMSMGDVQDSWPREPMEITQDIPWLLGQSVAMGGVPFDPRSDIEWLRKYGKLRSSPLRPADNPLLAAEDLMNEPRFKLINESDQEHCKSQLREQAYAMTAHLFEPLQKIQRGKRDIDGTWPRLLQQSKELSIYWDVAKQEYAAKNPKLDAGK